MVSDSVHCLHPRVSLKPKEKGLRLQEEEETKISGHLNLRPGLEAELATVAI